jgi:hypothetical protein
VGQFFLFRFSCFAIFDLFSTSHNWSFIMFESSSPATSSIAAAFRGGLEDIIAVNEQRPVAIPVNEEGRVATEKAEANRKRREDNARLRAEAPAAIEGFTPILTRALQETAAAFKGNFQIVTGNIRFKSFGKLQPGYLYGASRSLKIVNVKSRKTVVTATVDDSGCVNIQPWSPNSGPFRFLSLNEKAGTPPERAFRDLGRILGAAVIHAGYKSKLEAPAHG